MLNEFETNFISKTKEKTPFVDIPTQNFFFKWCAINDSIVPKFVSREEWQKRDTQKTLKKNDEGEQILFLPKDLHLWEMVDIIKEIDYDTLSRNPEKREERAGEIKKLGEIFEKAGIYLNEQLSCFEEKDSNAKQIAKDIAREFYQYGLSLQNKKENKDNLSENNDILSSEDRDQLDKWFLGKDVYLKKITKLGKNPTEKEKEVMREHLLQVYFKSLSKKGYKAEGEKPWEIKVGPIQYLQDSTKKQITKAIEKPEREMKTAIFRRGVEKLVTEMEEVNWKKPINDFLKELGFNPLLEQKRLYDTLQISKLKTELEEVKKTKNLDKISTKELGIAKKIQKAVSSFPYKAQIGLDIGPNYPAKMLETQFINCVGSSILGGGLLDEVGIKYLLADLPEHSATVLITSDNKVYWQDFTPGNFKENYTEISSDMIEENSIYDLIHNLNNSKKSLTFKKWNPYKLIINNQLKVNLFNPEMGLQAYILNNTGNTLMNFDMKEETVEAFKQAIKINPKFSYPYNGLGNALANLGKIKEAVEAYKKFVSLSLQKDYGSYIYTTIEKIKILEKKLEKKSNYSALGRNRTRN